MTKTRKDRDGDILALCNPNEGWLTRKKEDAINDIENGNHQYYVVWRGNRKVIHVVNDRLKGKYLRTGRDETERNNLDDLPNC